tara:strand:+ start:27 stop:1976 length:1950 start_codon:yes stop_codon:yes gene_type:complete
MTYPTAKKLSNNNKALCKFNAITSTTEDGKLQLKNPSTNNNLVDSTLTLDSTYSINGTDGIKLNWDYNAVTNEQNASVRMGFPSALNLSGANTFGVLVYIEGTDENTELGWWGFNQVELRIQSDKTNNFGEYTSYRIRGAASSNVGFAKLGYWWINFDLGGFKSQLDGFAWKNIEGVHINFAGGSFGTSTIHFLDMVVDPVPNRVPRVAICFDDGTESDWTEAYSYMQPKGIPGTSFLQYDKVNNPADSGRTSLDQVKTMEASGLWCNGYHFTSNGGAFLNLYDATASQRIAAHIGWQTFCTTNGLESGRRSFAYPESKNSLLIRQELFDNGIYYARAGLGSNLNKLTENNDSQDPVNSMGGFGLDDQLRVTSMRYNPDSADEKADRNYLGQGVYHARSTQGSQTAASSTTVLTDDQAQFWTTDEYEGFICENVTDGSAGFITAGTPTTQTVSLSGGTDNTWSTGDKYRIRYPDNVYPRLTNQADLILDRVLNTNSDAVITYHGIVASGASGMEVDRADFRYFVDKVAALHDAGVIEAVKFEDMFTEPTSGGGGLPRNIVYIEATTEAATSNPFTLSRSSDLEVFASIRLGANEFIQAEVKRGDGTWVNMGNVLTGDEELGILRNSRLKDRQFKFVKSATQTAIRVESN